MKVIVKKIENTHLAKRVEWMLNEKIYNQMPVPFPANIEATKVWFSHLENYPNRLDFTFLDSTTNDIIAFAGIGNINQKDKIADFYIFVSPFLSGKGIGTACMKWLIEHCFFTINLNRIYCYTIGNNDGANNFYEKLGFKLEGTLRNHMFFRGKFVDRKIWGLLKEEWIRNDQRNNEMNGFHFSY
jgi:RimJ/RimL family protein N-acetyltransferase